MSATYKCDICDKDLGKIWHYNPYETSEFTGDVLVKFKVNFNQWTDMGICEICARKKIKEAAKKL